MTNKELEKLFQNKLGSRKVDFNPSSWAGMERMLNSKMPVVPWYMPFAAWVKGLTAAMVIAFSGYFIIGEPFEGYTKTGVPSDPNEQTTPLNTISNSGNTYDKSNSFRNNTSISITPQSNSLRGNGSSQISSGQNSSTSSRFSPNSEQNANGFAYADGDHKNKKRRNKRRSKNESKDTPVDERFVENEALEVKTAPTLEVEYVEPSLLASSDNSSQKNKKNSNNKHGKSPLVYGFNVSAISSKNLLPQSETTLNTNLKPAFSIGFIVAQPINKNWGLMGGLNYKWQMANATAVKHDVSYSFGEENIFTTTEYKSLNSIELPLSTYYKFTDRHQVNIGVYASYLFAARVKYSVETIQAFSSSRESGQLFNNSEIQDVWDYGLTSSYYYTLNSRIQLGVDGWFGITQLQYNPDLNLRSNSLQLRFSLNYWLF